MTMIPSWGFNLYNILESYRLVIQVKHSNSKDVQYEILQLGNIIDNLIFPRHFEHPNFMF